jgi:hypothetical protein
VQKIYDTDIDRNTDIEITKRIANAHPYEELLPEYKVCIKNDGTPNNKSAELIKKSKLEYLRNYVDEMTLDDVNFKDLDKNKLFDILEKYYKNIVGV